MKNNAGNGWDENIRLLEELEEFRRLIGGSFASHQIRNHSRRDRKESGQRNGSRNRPKERKKRGPGRSRTWVSGNGIRKIKDGW
jgi:hypothetical protein